MKLVLIHRILLKKLTSYLDIWKPDVDKLDIDKLKNTPKNLRNLKGKIDQSDAATLVPVPVDISQNDIIKKDVYIANIKYIEDKIHGITNLGIRTTLNAKINYIKNEIPSISNIATVAAPTNIENKTVN